MSKPITLWRRHALLTSDDACTTIHKYALAPLSARPPYEASASQAAAPRTFSYVPSLTYFCIQKLIEHPDQLHILGTFRLVYQPPNSPEAYDILRALIPSYRPTKSLDLSQVDPRLWSVIVQLYTGLPENLRTYKLPLADPHLPLLQRIPSTPDFALITVLELPGCLELTDDTVVELRALHGMCALDASGTVLTARGVRTLAKTLGFAEDEDELDGILRRPRRGPWGLQILSLRGCVDVKSDILDCLTMFPLLSVVDLRGTRCKDFPFPTSPFKPSAEVALYHPASISSAFVHFRRMYPESTADLSNSEPLVLHVKGLKYEKPSSRVPAATQPPYLYPSRTRTGIDVFQPFDHSVLPPWRSYGAYDTNLSQHPHIGDVEDDPFYSDLQDENMVEYCEHSGSFELIESEHFPEYLQAAAAREARLHARRQSALRFYQRFLTPHSISDLPKRHTSGQCSSRERAETPHVAFPAPDANPFTLLRRPPPWSSLQAVPDAETGAIRKRQRMDAVTDGTPLRADEAQKTARATGGVSCIVGMVLQRAQADADVAGADARGQDQDQTARPVSKNPFARTPAPATRKSQDSGRRVSHFDVATSGAASVSSASASTSKPWTVDAPAVSKLKPDKLVDPSRPVRPITSLKIPPLPPSIATAPSASKAKGIRETKGKKSVSSGTETTLPMKSVSRQSSSKGLSDRGASKPRSQADKGGNAKKGQSGFNWKGWSAGY